MKYKFIGTEQDLKENGFEVVPLSSGDIYALNRKRDLFIGLVGCNLKTKIILHNQHSGINIVRQDRCG